MYYESQGNLHDAYLWAWVFAIRYVASETTLPYVLEHLVMIHFSVLLSWGLLWYFGIRQGIEALKSLRTTTPGTSTAVVLVVLLGGHFLTITIGWRFPGPCHPTVHGRV